MTPDPTQERTHRYTEAIRDVYHSEIFDWVPETAERIVAVADAEQADLRAEVERLARAAAVWMDAAHRWQADARDAVARAEAAERALAEGRAKVAGDA